MVNITLAFAAQQSQPYMSQNESQFSSETNKGWKNKDEKTNKTIFYHLIGI